MRSNKEIPTKNYVFCFLIFLAVIIISLVSFIGYNNQMKMENNVPYLRGKVLELNVDSLDEYLQENDDLILYVGVANDDNSRELEEKMESLIDDGKLNITYLNITEVRNKKNFYKRFNDKYSFDVKLSNYPALVYILDGRINRIIEKDDSKLTIKEVREFLDLINGDKND